MRILFILMTSTILLQAQPKILVNEDFSSNNRGWQVDQYTSIEDGTMLFNSPEDGDQSFISVYLDEQKDFIISADFIQKSGLANGGFGLVWGVGEENYNLFLISSDGYYGIHSGDPAHLKNWKKSSAIKSLGQVNRLKVEHRGGAMTFYINGTKVDEHKSFQLYGSWIGFIALSQLQLSIDNFQLSQDQKIDLPEKVETFDTKENLGGGVNSAEDELGPIISADGKTLYFARQNVKENVGGVYDDEDVWISRWENGAWSTAKNMGRVVNTAKADNLVAVSSDNNTLVFEEDDVLAVRHRTATGWSELERLDLVFKNEYDYFVAHLSADGKAVIFSAKLKHNVYYDPKRQEGDLYVCLKDKNNKWSAPINIGKTINTPGDETSPFLSADGKTLYFATDGRPGYGYQDIFFAQRTGEGWTDWSKPVNLGPGVNTTGFDAYYSMPAAGDYAYFVSYDKGLGKGDIFRIKLHEDVKPKPVLLVKGMVLNSATKKPLGASIHFENLVTGVEVGEARSDPKTGDYQIILPYGTHYGMRARVDGFYSVHENLELQQNAKYDEVVKDLILTPIEIGETIKMNNIFFEAGLAVLKSESYPELDRLVKILNDNPGIHIDLAGHTDNRGDTNSLMKLSKDRVAAVKEYLVKNGIAEQRIFGQGYGATQPIAPGDTEENRKLNRRVEFKITKK